MAPAVIAALISAAASLYGQYKSSKANKEATDTQLANETQKRKELGNWYDRNYNQDPTKRADAQRLLRQLDERIKRSNRQAAGRAAVMGGTEASVAATKEANAKAMADAIGDIYANNERRKDALNDQYVKGLSGISDNESRIYASAASARANNIAGAVKGVGSAAGQLAGALSESDSSGSGQPVKNTMGSGQKNYGLENDFNLTK